MNSPSVPKALFRIGHIFATPNVLCRISHDDVLAAIRRHKSGDWGELSASDRRLNEDSPQAGSRLLSVYRAENGTKFWVITEADRSATTVLLPEDY
jgi:hypothetical protein